jgi:hypothetical protein
MGSVAGTVEYDRVFVVFENCGDGKGFQPIGRENIPDWLRDEDVIDRMLGGEIAQLPNDKRIYMAVEVDRPRPVGQRKQVFGLSKVIVPGDARMGAIR